MEKTIQNNTVATTNSPETDALVQAAINDSKGNSSSATSLFWMILVAFLVMILVMRKKRSKTTETPQKVEYGSLSTFALSESLSLSKHQESGSNDI